MLALYAYQILLLKQNKIKSNVTERILWDGGTYYVVAQLCPWTNLPSLQGKNKEKKIGSAEFGSEKLGYEEAIWNTSQMKIKN